MAATCDDANRYELEGLLGRGAMGVVYRARERASGRPVALKLLETPDANQRLARFQREGQVTAALNHPGIVRVHSTGTLQGKPFLAYELVEAARPLDEVLRQATLRQRVRLLRDVAAALGYAHARGVVHRDVKPDNVLVDASGAPRVLDFGVAAHDTAERLTQTGAMVGTPAYMAPEQFRGERPSPATDVWALGVMLYEALTGMRPFEAESLPELFAQVHRGRPRPPSELEPSVPRELGAICLSALGAEPARRPADGQALATSLDAWLEGRTPAADHGGLRLVAPLVVAACVVSAVAAWVAQAEAVPRVADRAGAVVAPEPRAPVAPTPSPDDPDPAPRSPNAELPERSSKVRLLEGLAAAGDPGALLSVGRYHWEGQHGYPQDHAQAVDHFQRAAEAGSLEALRELALAYRLGLGVPRDLARAATLYQEAAQAGDAESKAWLGWHLEQGQGVAQDDAQAATWYRRAGDVRLAQRRLAQLLLKGRVPTEAGEDPIALLTAAANAGSQDAHLQLGLLYLRGSFLVAQDRRRARFHLERARAAEAAPYLGVLDQEDAR